jgi:metal-responsive CopG/Arc/MetJ family transcriptional regulator
MKKALVALPDQIWDIIDSELKGKMGEGHSDIIRAIVIAYLSDTGYLDKGGKVVNEKRKQ